MDARKIEILNAIIKSYIESAIPVGSRTVSKESGLGISSATIRNEMADLEELGYLNKPHSSAGRVPSDKAYRFYVDEFFDYVNREIRVDETLRESIVENSSSIEDIYRNSVKLLAYKTNCTSYIITPKKRDTRINYIDLIKLDTKLVLLLLIGNKGVVEKEIIRIDKVIKIDDLQRIKNMLNGELTQVDFDEIEGLKVTITGELTEYSDFIYSVIQRASSFNSHVKSIDIYYDGLRNVLNFSEFQDLERAREFMKLMEDSSFATIVQSMEDDDVEILIGEENDNDILKNHSIIRARLKPQTNALGQIGIIGPVRMDYLSLVNSVLLFRNNLRDILGSYISEVN